MRKDDMCGMFPYSIKHPCGRCGNPVEIEIPSLEINLCFLDLDKIQCPSCIKKTNMEKKCSN